MKIKTPLNELPFVLNESVLRKGINRWHVKPIENYTEACKLGNEYAAHFVQYLKDNPNDAGSNLLGIIASDIDFKDETCAKGYWIGFFSYLELQLYKRAKKRNVFRDLVKHRAKYPQED